MASRGFGVSFLPGADQSNGPAAPRNPMQEAIQVLSLRLPKVFGARSLAPAPLLTAPGGMGQPAARGNVAAQALAQMAGLPPGAMPPQMAAPMVPPPMGLPSMAGPPSAPAPMMDQGPPIFRVPQQPDRPRPETIYRDSPPSPSGPPPVLPPPRITPRQETGEGPSQAVPLPPPWIDPRPSLPAPQSAPLASSVPYKDAVAQALLRALFEPSRSFGPY